MEGLLRIWVSVCVEGGGRLQHVHGALRELVRDGDTSKMREMGRGRERAAVACSWTGPEECVAFIGAEYFAFIFSPHCVLGQRAIPHKDLPMRTCAQTSIQGNEPWVPGRRPRNIVYGYWRRVVQPVRYDLRHTYIGP